MGQRKSESEKGEIDGSGGDRGREYDIAGDYSLESLYAFDSTPLNKFENNMNNGNNGNNGNGNGNKSIKNALLSKLKIKVARRNSFDIIDVDEEDPSQSAGTNHF